MTALEKRLNAFRPDLADARLQGQVDAQRFVTGSPRQLISPLATLYRTPEIHGRQQTQVLFGETCQLFDEQDGFAYVQLDGDGYVGYLTSESLTADILPASHKVSVPATLRYPQADLKSQPVQHLLMQSRLCVAETVGDFVRLANGGFVFAKHLSPATAHANDFVAEAERFLHVPYLWGGRSAHGIDCSGLVQLALQATGIFCPRDADLQEQQLGQALLVNDLDGLRRGDLVFWKGHVGIMTDAQTLLHANGYHMATIAEPLHEAVARIALNAGPPTSIKRL